MTYVGRLDDITFLLHHNPNCSKRYQVRLVGKSVAHLDNKLGCLSETNDIIGHGYSFEEAAKDAWIKKFGEKKTFQVIRASEDYAVVVIVSPEGASLDDEGVEFWVRNWNQYDDEDYHSAEKKDALMYFNGMAAQSFGFGEIPEESLESLEEAKEWVDNKRKEYIRKWS